MLGGKNVMGRIMILYQKFKICLNLFFTLLLQGHSRCTYKQKTHQNQTNGLTNCICLICDYLFFTYPCHSDLGVTLSSKVTINWL